MIDVVLCVLFAGTLWIAVDVVRDLFRIQSAQDEERGRDA